MSGSLTHVRPSPRAVTISLPPDARPQLCHFCHTFFHHGGTSIFVSTVQSCVGSDVTVLVMADEMQTILGSQRTVDTL